MRSHSCHSTFPVDWFVSALGVNTQVKFPARYVRVGQHTLQRVKQINPVAAGLLAVLTAGGFAIAGCNIDSGDFARTTDKVTAELSYCSAQLQRDGSIRQRALTILSNENDVPVSILLTLVWKDGSYVTRSFEAPANSEASNFDNELHSTNTLPTNTLTGDVSTCSKVVESAVLKVTKNN